jgi:uncharacterized protein
MPRPFCCRRIGGRPAAGIFKPVGIPMRELQEVLMTLDEFEALRLADLEGLYQEQAAEQMNVSRPTFSRIVDSARRKTADALVHGKALRIEGGAVRMEGHICCHLHTVTSIDRTLTPAIRRQADSTESTPETLPKEK